METKEAIEVLRKDEEYYNGIGKNYLSNSNINTLLKSPKDFHVVEPKSVDMIMGNAIHEITFFGSTNLPSIESSTRTTKVYRERGTEEHILLEKEMEACHNIAKTLRNTKAADILFDKDNIYEEPMIKDLFGNGVLWKGKADIINSNIDRVIDLKSTSNIDAFTSKGRMFNYDSQAWIYRELFGMEVMFFVIEKNSLRMKRIDVSDETYEKGRIKAMEAEQNYIDMILNKTSDPLQYVEYGIF